MYLLLFSSFQSDSSDDQTLTSLEEFLYQTGGDRWGGPGHVRHLEDDGGPGEAEEEARLVEVVQRRLVLEESCYREVRRGGLGAENKGRGRVWY